MSKDIWHTGKEIPDEDQYIVVKNNIGLYSVSSEFEYDLDRVEKWAYFDDFLALETELERTRKALDIALDKLKRIQKIYTNAPFNVPINYANVCTDMYDVATEQITALEQKDK